VTRRGALVRSWLYLAASAAFAAFAPLQPSLGRISFPTSGSAAAQPPFIRGVLLLHSFEYDDAIDAFREAERIDPQFAMAYWGEAMCFNQSLWFNENADKARDVLPRLDAAVRARPITPREEGYIDAVRRLYAVGDKAARNRAYAERMAELSRAYPRDDEAAALYALALLATIPPNRPNPDVSLKAGAIADAILARNPQHPGAAHYALHAYGDGEHAAMGLNAARLYARIAPASSHARHMPSHVFLPLGMWDDAAAADESAFEASFEWVKKRHASVAQEDFHSLSWLQYEYLQQGRFATAAQILSPLEQALAAPAVTGPHSHVESEIGRGFTPPALTSELASMRARLVVESGRWTDMKGRTTFDNLDELFALGVASAKLGDRPRADAVLEHLGKSRDAAPDPDSRQLAEIMQLEVAGAVASGAGDRAAALPLLERATELEAARAKPNARPYPIKPAVELYAETLLEAGNPQAAVRAFGASLSRTPRRAASLIGFATAAAAAGMREDAERTAREFLEMWKRADSDRSEIARARAIVTPQ